MTVFTTMVPYNNLNQNYPLIATSKSGLGRVMGTSVEIHDP